MPPFYFVAGGIVLGFVVALVLTGLIRRYALRVEMLDSPNERTLHSGDVPRGGGLSIVIALSLALLLLWFTYPSPEMPFLLAVAMLLAVQGWVDDRFGLSPLSRMVIQAVAAGIAVASIGELRSLSLAGHVFAIDGVAGAVVSVLWVVWLANAYNFMDGIDGLAAGFAAVVACVMGLWFTADQNGAMAVLCYVIMGSALGFLVWNWEPARIFMGDVGSVTLGGVFAVLVIIGNRHHDVPLTAYIILFGVFLFDTIVTLVRRLAQGKIIWQAHREHYYQRAVALGFGHSQVTIAVVATSLVLAALASLERYNVGPAGLWPFVALALLVALALVIHIKEKALIRDS